MNEFVLSDINGFIFISETKYYDPFIRYNHSLKYNELIFYVSGDSVAEIGGKQFHNVPGSGAIYPAGDWNSYTVQRKAPGSTFDIFFLGEGDFLPKEPTFYSPAIMSRLRPYFERAWRAWLQKGPGYRFQIASAIYSILAGIAEGNRKEYLPEDKLKKLLPAETYIEKNVFSPDFDYTRLPDLCGMGYTYFKNLFRKKYGMLPQKYIEKRRLDYACDLLRYGNLSVEKVAYLVGYHSVFYFSRVFKNAFGVPPSSWN